MEAGDPTNLPSFSSLPYEVIFNVLKNLPAKTLLRCRCVCKDWNSIITDQSFVNAHLLSQPEGHLFLHYYEPRYQPSSDKTQLCSFPDESFSLVQKFKVPLPYSSQQEPGRMLVGSVNGLLCLSDSKAFGRKLYLWNPTIRKYKTLSNTSFRGIHHQRYFHIKINFILGLGFRAPTSDYIIIRIALLKWRFRRRLKSSPSPQAEAYSLSTDSWKRVDFSEELSRRFIDTLSWDYVQVNGDLNWLAKFIDEEERPYESILSFDVNKEEFKEIKLPRQIYASFPNIAIHRGLLAVIDHPVREDGNEYLWLWTMEDYGKVDSWRRRAKVKTTGLGAFLDCTFDGRIMFTKSGGIGKIIELLDMETLQEQRFSIPDFQIVYPFKETLLSLEGANVVCE